MGLYERHVFNPLMDLALGTEAIRAERERVLRSARGRVLDVGIGTGLNLPAYPAQIRSLTGLSPDARRDPRAERRAAERPIDVRFVTGFAESLPFADGDFDTVVSTFLLCSVRDPTAALREFRRVLAPGGWLLFLEHVGYEKGGGARLVQQILNPVSLAIAGGCSLVRDTGETIRESGFAIGEFVDAPFDGLDWPHRRLVRGVAVPG